MTVVSCWCSDRGQWHMWPWPISASSVVSGQGPVTHVTLIYISCWCSEKTGVSDTCDLDFYNKCSAASIVSRQESRIWMTLTFIITVVSCCWCGDQTVVSVYGDLDLYHYSSQLLLMWGPDNGQCLWWPWPISLQWSLLVTLTNIITVVSCCWCGDQKVVSVTGDLDLYHYSG